MIESAHTIHKLLITDNQAMNLSDITELKQKARNAIGRGTLRMVGDKYVLADFFEVVLKKAYASYRSYLAKHPGFNKYVSQSQQGQGARKKLVSYYGMFYMASIVKYSEILTETKTEKTQPRHPVNPQLYILIDPGNKGLKIGFSICFENGRAKQHRTSSPFLKLLCLLPVADIFVERNIHKALAAYRVEGAREWYYDGLVIRTEINNFLLKHGIISKPLEVLQRYDPSGEP